MGNTERVSEHCVYDVVVIGGGVAGTIAAIAAARLGCRVALVQDRPVLGGSSSNEVRVSISGADAHGNNRNARETGILEELRQEITFRDQWPEGNGSPRPAWDWLLWEWANKEPNLSLYLNTRATQAVMAGPNRIGGITAHQSSTERALCLEAQLFIDCSGDGQIAADAGAEFRRGRESRHEFGEDRAPETADRYVLCPSLLFSAKNMGQRAAFQPPPWARSFPTEESLGLRHHPQVDYGYAWMEYGGTLDPIQDAEAIRDELVRLVFGVWDHVKNTGQHGAENYALDWVGSVLGKRESRRFVGDHVLCQSDIESRRRFDDSIAYCGWGLDHLHPPEGIYSQDPPQMWPQQLYLMARLKRWVPYGTLVRALYPDPPAHWPEYMPALRGLASIRFRCLYSRNVDNLLFAGRNISATHVAHGSTRVQGTCAILGQAAGTAAALCVRHGITPRSLGQRHIGKLQQQLVKDDCYIIGVRNSDPQDLARAAAVTASSSAPLQMAQATEWLPMSWARGQMISFSEKRVESIALLLASHAAEPRAVTATLLRGERLDDFHSQQVVAVARAVVPARSQGWVSFAFDCSIDPACSHWVRLEQDADIAWAFAPQEDIGAQRGEWFGLLGHWYPVRGTHCFRVQPESYPFQGPNVVSGVSRAEAGPNIWISDPQQGLPQWLELTLPATQEFDAVYLTFDTNLDSAVKEIPDPSSEQGFRLLKQPPQKGAAPECVRDYRLLVNDGAGYREVLHVEGNHHRRRVHHIGAVRAQRVRLIVEATHGAPSARVYEVRLYRESRGENRG